MTRIWMDVVFPTRLPFSASCLLLPASSLLPTVFRPPTSDFRPLPPAFCILPSADCLLSFARPRRVTTIPAMIDWDRVYHQVVNDNWTVLAAFAWKNYSDLGRGAVLVQVDQMMRAAPGTDELDVQVSYLPGSDMARLTADTSEFISQYDPQSEVVILFTGLDSGGNLAYRCKAGDGPLPPDAFRLYGHQLERWSWRLQ